MLGVVVVLLAGAGAVVAVQRVTAPLGRPAVAATLASGVPAAGSGPSLPWPAKGQGAVAVPALAFAAQSGPEAPIAVASLTKITTAVVVLRDHPLAVGAPGPTITVTAGDVAQYDAELHLDESTIPIQVGEVLTERQMLEALLMQSANDIAVTLARWDAGSQAAFVAKMNALAASLGMSGTHYADASGFDPQTVSTAADVLRIAAVGMADPAFAQIVDTTSATLPLVGTLGNIVSEIGSNGVVGVKSGYTSVAGACMVLAADQTVEGRQVLVLVAVLGQPTPPPVPPTTTTTTVPTPAAPAAPAPPGPPPSPPPPIAPAPSTTTTTNPFNFPVIPDPFKFTRPVVDALLAATRAAVVPVKVVSSGTVVGSATSTWGGTAHRVPVVAADTAWLAAWPGQQVHSLTRVATVPPGSPAGTRAGTALFGLGTQLVAVPLRLGSTVPEPSWWWRLLHSP